MPTKPPTHRGSTHRPEAARHREYDQTRRLTVPELAMAKRTRGKARWRRVRKIQLVRHPLCQPCLDDGRTTPATQVDHVLALAHGGAPYDLANLQSICTSCHARKSQAERRTS